MPWLGFLAHRLHTVNAGCQDPRATSEPTSSVPGLGAIPRPRRPARTCEDHVEGALARALDRASEAARFDVVAQLARELEARRLPRLPNLARLSRRSAGNSSPDGPPP